MDARWRPAALQPPKELSPAPTQRDSPELLECERTDVSRYGRRRRTAALTALQAQSGEEEDSPPPQARRSGAKLTASKATRRGAEAAMRAGGSSHKRPRHAAETFRNPEPTPAAPAVQPLQLPLVPAADVLDCSMPPGAAVEALRTVLGGMPPSAAAAAGALQGGLPVSNRHMPAAHTLVSAASAAAQPQQVTSGCSADWYGRQLQQLQLQLPVAPAQVEERRGPLSPPARRVPPTDGPSLMAAAAALTSGRQLPWAFLQLQKEHQKLLQEQDHQQLLLHQQHQQQRYQLLLQHHLQHNSVQQTSPVDLKQDEVQPRPRLPEQPSWASMPSLSMSLGSIGLLPLSGPSPQPQLLLPPLGQPNAFTGSLGGGLAAALGAGAAESSNGPTALQQQLGSLPWPLLPGQRPGDNGVAALLEAQHAQQAVLEWRKARVNGSEAIGPRAAATKVGVAPVMAAPATGDAQAQLPAPLPFWSWMQPQQVAAAAAAVQQQALAASRVQPRSGASVATGPNPFNPFAMAAAAAAGASGQQQTAALQEVGGPVPLPASTLSTELHSLFNSWQEGNVSFMDSVPSRGASQH